MSHAMQRLGTTMMYGWDWYEAYPSCASVPHEALGGLIPSPRKDRNASPSTTPGSSRKTKTMMIPSVFGSRCLKSTRYQRAPTACAART